MPGIIAKQNGKQVQVSEATGRYLWSKEGVLVSFTSDNVIIKQGSQTCLYEGTGRYLRQL